MDNEIEDIVGEVKYTDSQKSVTTRSSLAYSLDFTDCSSPRSISDKHNYSTGKETYVIECDSEDSEKSEPTYLLHKCLTNDTQSSYAYEYSNGTVMSALCGPNQISTKCASTSYHTMRSTIAQETYTQTSKTVIEIAEAEGNVRRVMESNTLETQTSLVSITGNKTVEYRIEVSSMHDHFTKSHIIGEHSKTNIFKDNVYDNRENNIYENQENNIYENQENNVYDNQENNVYDNQENNVYDSQENTLAIVEYSNTEPSPPMKPMYSNITCTQFLHAALDDKSSQFLPSEIEIETTEGVYKSDDECDSEDNSEKIIQLINDDSNIDITDDQTVMTTSSASENYPTDVEEDSLMEVKPKISNNDVKELHDKLSENEEVCLAERFGEPDIWRFGILTPLTEETNIKKESVQEMTNEKPNLNIGDTNTSQDQDDSFFRANPDINDANTVQEEVLFTSAAGVKVKMLKDDSVKIPFRLPAIQNQSCPNSPHLNSLFGKPKLNKAGTLPSVYERHSVQDRWEMVNKNLASGESPLISGRSEPPKKTNGPLQLPPIHGEAPISRKEKTRALDRSPSPAVRAPAKRFSDNLEAISIGEKIKELKMSSKRSWSQKYSSCSRTQSPSGSPDNTGCHDESREIAERGCEAVCAELLRRLRSNTWIEVVETLEELPKELDKFWGVMTETRIADLLRQVNMHVESPRTQVAKSACATAAALVKNTSYTRKPDFYETVTTLLIKTGSYSRVVRRAANLALDNIVCGVDKIHALTALCIHGVGHKNALVRCASARLIVVCCALAGGGRDLLRTRPASAASARRHVLRSLSVLLDDKSTDARKYAERLYSMLRPLSNFEAYYLTDVDVELASRQMKKYDQMLLPKETR